MILILDRSTFLHERDSRRSSQADGELTGRLPEWGKHLGSEDPEVLSKRLAWDGLNVLDGKRLLVERWPGEVTDLPDWMVHLQLALAESEVAECHYVETETDRIPFAPVLQPFVTYSLSRVSEAEPALLLLLSPKARGDLQRELLEQLAEIAARVLLLEFRAYCSVASPGQRFDRFVRELREGRLVHVLIQYPVLARFMGQALVFWIEKTLAFLNHLKQDAKDLAHMFGSGSGLGLLMAVRSNISDLHGGRRCVLGLSFESGVECYYKPRNMEADVIVQRLLQQLDDEPQVLALHVMGVLARGDHGWVEAVREEPLLDTQAAARYLERTGTLLFVCYLLGMNDCHMENVLTMGEHPVLIDAETILHGQAKPAEAFCWDAGYLAERQLFQDSVLRVGILPRWAVGSDGRRFDVSSLGGYKRRGGAVRRRVWRLFNSELMDYALEEMPVRSPFDSVASCSDFQALNGKAFLIRGFERAYRTVLRLRSSSELTDLDIFGKNNPELRFLARSTAVYQSLVDEMLSPNNLVSATKCSFLMERLRRNFLRASERPAGWPMVQCEIDCLSRLDIPRLTVRMRDRTLSLGKEQLLEGYLDGSGDELFQERWTRMSERDLHEQTAFIEMVMPSETAGTGKVLPRPSRNTSDGLSEDEAVAAAQRIAESIAGAAIRGSDGTVTWFTYGYHAAAQFVQFQPMGVRFFDGLAGCAVFLAAIGELTGEERFKELALAAIRVTMPSRSTWVAHMVSREGKAAASIAYAQLLVSEFLHEPKLRTEAISLLNNATMRETSLGESPDLLTGTAGLALVLARALEMTGDPALVPLLLATGERILSSRTATGTPFRSWATIGGRCLAGYAHGAAGIVHGLCAIHSQSGDQRMINAALEATAYEDTLFLPDSGNWLNLLDERQNGCHGHSNTWCHGAPGIGLARMQLLRRVVCKDLVCSVERTVQRCSAEDLTNIDHLCCGTMGRTDLLIEYARYTGDSRYLNNARRLAGEVVRRASHEGQYRLGRPMAMCIPSFYQGLAGIGYQLLRLAKPEQFRSVLSFQ